MDPIESKLLSRFWGIKNLVPNGLYSFEKWFWLKSILGKDVFVGAFVPLAFSYEEKLIFDSTNNIWKEYDLKFPESLGIYNKQFVKELKEQKDNVNERLLITFIIGVALEPKSIIATCRGTLCCSSYSINGEEQFRMHSKCLDLFVGFGILGMQKDEDVSDEYVEDIPCIRRLQKY